VKSKFIILLFSLLVLTNCSNMWLGASNEDINLEGKRLKIIGSDYDISPEDMLDENINLKTNIGFTEINKDWKLSLGLNHNLDFNYIPIYESGKIFTLSDKNIVSCIDVKTKDIQWQVRVSQKDEDLTGIFGGGITAGSNSILVSTGFGDVFSLSKNNGGMIWRYHSISPFYSAPYIKNGKVFIINRKNEMLALDEKEGEILWKHKGTPEEVSILSNLKIASTSNLIVPTYTSGEIFALMPSNGKKVWSESININSKSNSLTDISDISSIVTKSSLIASKLGAKIIALDIADGNRLWQKRLLLAKTPIAIQDYVFVLTEDNKLLALSALNGGVYWQTDLKNLYESNNKVQWSDLAIYHNNIVLTNSNKDIIFISADSGNINFRKNISTFSPTAPIFVENTMFILNQDNKLISYQLN